MSSHESLQSRLTPQCRPIHCNSNGWPLEHPFCFAFGLITIDMFPPTSHPNSGLDWLAVSCWYGAFRFFHPIMFTNTLQYFFGPPLTPLFGPFSLPFPGRHWNLKLVVAAVDSDLKP